MMHQLVHEDPDVTQAVQDLLGEGERLRQLSLSRSKLRDGSAQQRATDDMIRDTASRFSLRAERIGGGMTGAALQNLVEDALNLKARGGRPAPSRETARTVADRVAAAEARVFEAHRAVTKAQAELRAARDDLEAARIAAAAYGSKGRAA